MFNMLCSTQPYVWGQRGESSIVAKILERNGNLFFNSEGGKINNDAYYAEFWMGTHINGPSSILLDNIPINLTDYLSKISNNEINTLPFLLKVLSVKKPLSIQVHPNKEFAVYLNKNFPNIYKDDNPKPELSIAISDEFKMLYGITSIKDAVYLILSLNLKPIFEKHIKQIDLGIFFELAEKCNKYTESEITEKLYTNQNDDINKLKITYKLLLISVMETENYKQIINEILELFNKENFKSTLSKEMIEKVEYFIYFYSNFGEDKGLIFSLFMDIITLKKGNSIFIEENIPHSYISGDCIECMTNSDNTIRLGLTPKFIDSESFKKILDDNYKTVINLNQINNIGKNKFEINSNMCELKSLKVKDFKLISLSFDKEISYSVDNHSILFVHYGSMKIASTRSEQRSLEQFNCLFIEGNQQIKIEPISNENSVVYIATYF